MSEQPDTEGTRGARTATPDDATPYGRDQDSEGTSTAPGPAWQDAADRNPDDFGPDSQGDTEVNPATGREYGSID